MGEGVPVFLYMELLINNKTIDRCQIMEEQNNI